MRLYENQIFHIYNQGNNKRRLFLNDCHYKHFLWKTKAYLLPFGELISYCLMPNHYHFQFLVSQREILRSELWEHVDNIENERRIFKYGDRALPVNKMHHRIANNSDFVSINDAIGILQSSYTKHINRQLGWSGSMFRRRFKIKQGFDHEDDIIPIEDVNFSIHGCINLGYHSKCIEYIHHNPVKANLVRSKLEWRWSSFREYFGVEEVRLCNVHLGRKLIRGDYLYGADHPKGADHYKE